jgi:hypothetical protein
MEKLHIYADLVAAGAPDQQRYPGIAAHLRACGPCCEDFEGLLAAVTGRRICPRDSPPCATTATSPHKPTQPSSR